MPNIINILTQTCSHISSPMIYIYFPLLHRALYCFPQNTPRRSTVTLNVLGLLVVLTTSEFSGVTTMGSEPSSERSRGPRPDPQWSQFNGGPQAQTVEQKQIGTVRKPKILCKHKLHDSSINVNYGKTMLISKQIVMS